MLDDEIDVIVSSDDIVEALIPSDDVIVPIDGERGPPGPVLKIVGGLANGDHEDFGLIDDAGDGGRFVALVAWAVAQGLKGIKCSKQFLADWGGDIQQIVDGNLTTTPRRCGIGFKNLPVGFIFDLEDAVIRFPQATLNGSNCRAAVVFGNCLGLVIRGKPLIKSTGSLDGQGIFYFWDYGYPVTAANFVKVDLDFRTKDTFNTAFDFIGCDRMQGRAIVDVERTKCDLADREGHGFQGDAYQDVEDDESVQIPVFPGSGFTLEYTGRNVQGADILSQGGARVHIVSARCEWIPEYLNHQHTSDYYACRLGNGSRAWTADTIRAIRKSRGLRLRSIEGAWVQSLFCEDLEMEAARVLYGSDLSNSVVPGSQIGMGHVSIKECNRSYLVARKKFLYGSIEEGSNIIKDLTTVLKNDPEDPTVGAGIATPMTVDQFSDWCNYAASPTSISNAAEGVFDFAPSFHGFTNGDSFTVLDDSAEGMPEINGEVYTVSDATDATFKIKDGLGAYIDTTGFGIYTGGAMLLKQGHVTWLDIGGFTKAPMFIGGYVDENGNRVGLADANPGSGDDRGWLWVVDADGDPVGAQITRTRVTDDEDDPYLGVYDSGIRCCGNTQNGPMEEAAVLIEGGSQVHVESVQLKTTTGRVKNALRLQEAAGEMLRLCTFGAVSVEGAITGPEIYVHDRAYLAPQGLMRSHGTSQNSLLDSYRDTDGVETIRARGKPTITPTVVSAGKNYVSGNVTLNDRSTVGIVSVDGDGGLLSVNSQTAGSRGSTDYDGICALQAVVAPGGADLDINGALATDGVVTLPVAQTINVIFADNATARTVTLTGIGPLSGPSTIINGLKPKTGQAIVDKRGFMNGGATSNGGAFLGYPQKVTLQFRANPGTPRAVRLVGTDATGADQDVTYTDLDHNLTVTDEYWFTVPEAYDACPVGTPDSTVKLDIGSTGEVVMSFPGGNTGTTKKVNEQLANVTRNGVANAGGMGIVRFTGAHIDGPTTGITIGVDGLETWGAQFNSRTDGSLGGAGVIVRNAWSKPNQSIRIMSELNGSIFLSNFAADGSPNDLVTIESDGEMKGAKFKEFTVAELLDGVTYPAASHDGETVKVRNNAGNKPTATSHNGSWRTQDGLVVTV